MKKLVLKERMNSFGYYDSLEDTKDISEIMKSLNNKEDHRYFDKYGNEYTIEELLRELKVSTVDGVKF